MTVRQQISDGRPSARIVGAGLAHAADRDGVSDPPDAPFPEAKKAVPHVGVLHAPPRSPQRRTPQSALWKAMKKADYDYWALGGASHHQTVGKKERAWHAGPTAGRHPSEAGPQGGLLVTLEAGEKPQVAFRPFAPLCWADLVLDDLENAATAHALLQRAQQAFAPVRGEGTRTAWLVRFTLTGSCPLASALRQEDDRARLEARLTQHLDIDAAFVRLRHLTPPAHPERHRNEPHVLSEVLALLDRAAEDTALLRELAPRELAAAPSEDPQEDYLHELIEALDREACARLLREPPSETPSETSSE
jgi:DNA repair exonuclease SbcCD nuclease subunit